MKKLIAILVVLLTLVGCGAQNSKITGGDDVIFTGPNNLVYTKNDLYDSLKIACTSISYVSNETSDPITIDILYKVGEKEPNIDLESLKVDADSMLNMYLQFGYTEENIAQAYGSVDFFKEYYIFTAISDVLMKAYATEKYDELVKDDSPVKMQVASFKDKESAIKTIEDVNNGSTFDMAAINNGYGSSTAARIYSDTDADLNLQIKDYLNSTDSTGISSVIEAINSTDTSANSTTLDIVYYVVNVLDRDVNNFKDEYIDYRGSSLNATEVIDYYLNKHDIKFYDQVIYDEMIKVNSVYK